MTIRPNPHHYEKGEHLLKAQKIVSGVEENSSLWKIIWSHYFFYFAIFLLLSSATLSYSLFEESTDYANSLYKYQVFMNYLHEAELTLNHVLNIHHNVSSKSDSEIEVEKIAEDIAKKYNIALNRYETTFAQMENWNKNNNLKIETFKQLKTASVDFFETSLKMLEHKLKKHSSSNHESRSPASENLDLKFYDLKNELTFITKHYSEKLDNSRKNMFFILIFGNGFALLILALWKNRTNIEKSKLIALNHLLAEQQTELFEAQRIAEEAEKTKDTFLANISHEIRTPLNAILGLSHLLKKTALNELQRKYLFGLNDSSKSLLELINGILDFSKIRDKGFALEQKPTNLSNVIFEVRSIFEGQAEIKKIKIITEVDPKIQILLIDSTRIRQILINLVGNAVKFTDSGFVKLCVKLVENQQDIYGPTATQEQTVRFEVQDSGLGIPKSEESKMFEIFYQTHASAGKNAMGTGLGLAICKMLVNKMHGTIGFKNNSPKGTIFWAEIAASITDLKPLEKLEFNQDLSSKKGLKIMIIEDNALNELVLRGLLEELGYNSVSFDDALQAIQLLAQEEFDFIFLDLQMPGMTGFDVIKKIKDLEKQKIYPSKIIATTAHTSDGYKIKALSEGFDQFLSKPIEVEELSQILFSPSKSEKEGDSEKKLVGENILYKITDEMRVEDKIPHLNKEKWEKWARMKTDNDNYLSEMANLFLSTFEAKWNELNSQFYITADLNEVSQSAHYLKASCSNMGANYLEQLFVKLETMADNNESIHKIETLMHEIEQEFYLIKPEISSCIT